MTFVGDGRGDWVTETSYKYVGPGSGNLAVLSPSRSYMPLLVLALAVLVVVLALVLWPFGAATTTTVLPLPAVAGKCLFWGDPHILTFDGERPSFYGDGEFWIVKSRDVKIQGRYMGTPYTYGLAATQKVAIGGPFIGGHTIEVEPMEPAFGGHIIVDGVVVLTSFGHLDIGGASVKYDDKGELPDKAASIWDRNIVHLDLPRGIKMTVFRWGNYMDLSIEMDPLPEGQDGSCGNYNGIKEDDTTEAIFGRLGARVADQEMLFHRHAQVLFSSEMEEMMRTKCAPNKLIEHEQTCRQEMRGVATSDAVSMNSCIFDLCFGMNEHALQTAKTFATEADKAAAHAAG